MDVEMEKDALRYRWLRGKHWHDSADAPTVVHSCMVQLGARCYWGEFLDDEIDRQMLNEIMPAPAPPEVQTEKDCSACDVDDCFYCGDSPPASSAGEVKP
jgi:hypothetical protein